MKNLLLLLTILLIVQNIFAQFEESIPSKAITREFSEIKSKFEVIVTVNVKYELIKDIDKNNFARLVEILPNNSEINIIKSGNADYNKTLNILKFYWDNKKLPKEDFTIEYELIFDLITVDKCIEGEFGYFDKSNNIIVEEIGGENCIEN